MKRFIIITAAALCLALDASAQVGIIGGLTSSQTTLEGAIKAENIASINQYHAGLAYRLPLGQSFAIQPAVIYNVKGTTVSEAFSTLKFQADMKTGFIEVPVQIQLGASLGNLWPYVFAEPFVGYGITNEYKFTATIGGISTEDIKSDWDNIRSRLEYGFGLGAGIMLGNLQLSAKYFWNMGNLYNEDALSSDLTAAGVKEAMTSQCTGIVATLGIFF